MSKAYLNALFEEGSRQDLMDWVCRLNSEVDELRSGLASAGHDKASFRNGVRHAITWLHAEAVKMNDPHARMILNSAGFHLGLHLAKDV